MSVTLDGLAERGLLREIRGDGRTRVQGAAQDSRRIEAGDLFLAISGTRTDGARFVKDAINRGAVAVAAAEPLEGLSVPTAVFCHPAREAVMHLANAVYGDATRALFTIGITGTNGKTTTAYLLDEALSALDQRPALLGTIEARGPGGYRDPSALTTPEADTIERFARRMQDAGATHLVMEVSSHALSQERVDGVCFEVAAFSNLTQDHLDFHGSMEAYFEAKARLFFELAPAHAVVNVDDPAGKQIASRIALGEGGPTLLRVSSKSTDAEVHAVSVTSSRAGMRIVASTPLGPLHIESSLLGAHNVDNLLLAAGCLLASARRPLPTLARLGAALSAARGAPGRLERVADPRDVAILVDYAHSPDALEKALLALRPITPGRLLCVFGCGGDRDKGKRPLMGAVAKNLADLVFVTSDNPRTEDPASIVREIEIGLAGAPFLSAPEWAASGARGFTSIVDRRTAIRTAIAAARPGDTVLIAGKGHEDYQILGTEKIHFDDRLEARAAVDLVTKGGA